MKVLVACEESQEVTAAFIALGHDAMSCDIAYPGAKGLPHYQGDVRDLLGEHWDLMIAHPPCTYLSYAATRVWNEPGRAEKRQDALDFFLMLYNMDIPRIAVENPVGYANTVFRKPDQIIQPYFWGDPHKKRTCLWLKNLPVLHYDKNVQPPEPLGYYQTGPKKGKAIWFSDGAKGGKLRAHYRSKTFPGIARAMAEQWGGQV